MNEEQLLAAKQSNIESTTDGAGLVSCLYKHRPLTIFLSYGHDPFQDFTAHLEVRQALLSTRSEYNDNDYRNA